MKTEELIKKLEHCSKTELIKIILKVSENAFTIFYWNSIINEVKISTIYKKIEICTSELTSLMKSFETIPKNERIIENDKTRNLMIKINNCRIKYLKLLKQLEKEVY